MAAEKIKDQEDTYKDIVLGGRGEGGAFEVIKDLRAVRASHENLETWKWNIQTTFFNSVLFVA